MNNFLLYKVKHMKLIFNFFLVIVFSLIIISKASAMSNTKEQLVIELKDGNVVIDLREDLAPKHVERIKKLTNEGFYDNIIFHRVIDGFMAQTGDPTGTGMGGSDYPDLPAEFTPEPFERGAIGMARSQSPNSANSQFFICFKAARFLDNQYTVWGNVVKGMEYVDNIEQGEPPEYPDKIIKMSIISSDD